MIAFIRQIIYLGKKYDLLTATEVVEHLDDPLDYFSLFENLLKDDGVLSIMTKPGNFKFPGFVF
ncbi:methyltransferase domain-containing protein [Acetobacterium sp.]|uniref:methyltransferase domain-containing protein n=1 Tax=Acetobacterium sp. TaxID=1872094 RepID=UPI002728BF67|nr:methyltransferase domain-containing protein [Acetobacterium sp.]MDO9493204.1 hypothetical protein [Acetobacterium sp.]